MSMSQHATAHRLLHQDIQQQWTEHASSSSHHHNQLLTPFDDHQQPHDDGSTPASRFGHTAVLHGESMFIFGGRRDDTYHNDTWEFKMRTGEWRKLKDSESMPKPRAGHTACVSGDNMFVFAGAVSAQDTNAEMWTLNLQSQEWKMIDNGRRQCCAHQRATTANSQRHRVSDKGNASGAEPSSVSTSSTTRDENRSSQQQQQVQKPSRRRGHTALPFGTKMLIFGGCGEFVNDNSIWQFDTETNQWNIVETIGERPSTRMYHVSEKIAENKMIVFGGRAASNGEYLNDLFEFDISLRLWKKINSTGSVPSGRMCSSSISRQGVVCVFFGGAETVCDDSYELNTETMNWRVIESGAAEPDEEEEEEDGDTETDRASSSAHSDKPMGSTCPTTVVYDNTVMQFGGHDGTAPHNTLRTLQLAPPSLKSECRRWLRAAHYQLRHSGGGDEHEVTCTGGLHEHLSRYVELDE